MPTVVNQNGLFAYDNNMIEIDGNMHYICYDWDDIKKTKTYYPATQYKYRVVLPGCMREDQVIRLIRRKYGL